MAERVLRWEDPPPSGKLGGSHLKRRPSRWRVVAEELRLKPGAWGVVYESDHGAASGLATEIRLGCHPIWQPTGTFEAVTRKLDGRTAVYARYIGEAGIEAVTVDE